MSEALNIIKAHFGSLREVTTAPVWQYNYGQKLKIDGIPNLPSTFEIHYSNSKSRGTAKRWIGYDGVVDVLDEYFRSGADIWGFILLHEGEDDGETEYVIHIPVKERSEAEDSEPTPVQRDIVDEAIAALNQAVEQCEAYVEHYPTVIDGEWYVWDEETEQFVTTGVAATGNGIASARLNNDYTLTLVFTDGTSLTTPISIRGAQGEKGDTGAVPDFSIGTVTTLPAGSSASASITGTQEEPVLNLSIPQGQDGAITNLDTTLTKSGKAADAKAVGNKIATLPNNANSTETNVDLDVTDPDGNVLVRFADGHIKTKEFNSAHILDDLYATPEETDADLYISDNNGNVIVYFADGGIRTAEFDSKMAVLPHGQLSDQNSDLNIVDASGNVLVRFADGNIRTKNFDSDNNEYVKTFEFNGAGSQSIDHFFPSGSVIMCHMVKADVKGWYYVGSYAVTYSYTDRDGYSHVLGSDYGYNFPRFVIPTDAVSITVSYGGDFITGASYAFTVYANASFEKKPKIITVSASGGKDFTTLRAAIESIPNNVCEMNPYEIYVYPGTYNVLDDFTAEEIATDGFKGLWFVNGMSLIGVGRREEIVIKGILSPDDYPSSKRNDISTLNVIGNINVENLTVEAYNIRYAVHDEEKTLTHHITTHKWKNVKFFGRGLTSGGGGNTSYGSGSRSYVNFEFTDCDFSDKYVLHTDTSLRHPICATFKNCSARRFSFGDYDTGGVVCHAYFYNCKASVITIEASSTHDQYFYVHAIGVQDAMCFCPAGYVYENGETLRFNDISIPAGYAVKIVNIKDSRQNNLVVTSVIDDVYGISIGTIGDDTVIQIGGYINSNVLGLNGLSVGDYLTIDNTGAVVVGTSSNAIAQVKMVDDGVAFAKLTI